MDPRVIFCFLFLKTIHSTMETSKQVDTSIPKTTSPPETIHSTMETSKQVDTSTPKTTSPPGTTVSSNGTLTKLMTQITSVSYDTTKSVHGITSSPETIHSTMETSKQLDTSIPKTTSPPETIHSTMETSKQVDTSIPKTTSPPGTTVSSNGTLTKLMTKITSLSYDTTKSVHGITSSPDHQSGKTYEAIKFEQRYFWILLLLLPGAVALYLIFKCCKVQHHKVDTMDHGTENASFQRTESNKDGVMFLGVKSRGEEDAAAK